MLKSSNKHAITILEQYFFHGFTVMWTISQVPNMIFVKLRKPKQLGLFRHIILKRSCGSIRIPPKELAVELYCVLRTKYNSHYYMPKYIYQGISLQCFFMALSFENFTVEILEAKSMFLAKPGPLSAAARVEDTHNEILDNKI